MPIRKHEFAQQPPPWWPENEAWPPMRDRMHHSPFFRRIGCAFVAFNLAGMGVLFLAAAGAASLLGLVRPPQNLLPWLLPVGAGALILAVALVGAGVSGMRRVFRPLDDLLQSAEHVAQGDYAIRVPERGPREVRSLARAFNNMAERLHDTDEKRRNLLADVTHELRTPLTVIRGNLEGMLDGIYPADETNLRSLLEETDLLNRLVEDLRTLALAESGALKLQKEACDLPALVSETLAAFQVQAQTAGVSLKIEAAGDLPALQLDAVRMRQVLSNLVSNALRYSPRDGRVLVKCFLDAEWLALEVQDDGPGIPPADLSHVFERFYKSTDSGGMGLGLAIARHLVNAHGGTIEARSDGSHGATIRIKLPISDGL